MFQGGHRTFLLPRIHISKWTPILPQMYASEKVSSSVGRSLYLKGAVTDDKPSSRKASNRRGSGTYGNQQVEPKKGERKMVAGKSWVASARHKTDTEGRTEMRKNQMLNCLVRRVGGQVQAWQ